MKSGGRANRALVALTVVVIAIALVLVVVIGYWIVRPVPFDPLSFDTVRVQEVTPEGVVVIPQVEGFTAPSLYDDDAVPVLFSFCSTSPEEFEAVGNSWFVNSETGERYPLNTGIVSTVRPGCVSPRVAIEIPAQVRVDIEDVASGLPASPLDTNWYITGELRPNKDGGIAAEWQTERFLIIAERRPRGEDG